MPRFAANLTFLYAEKPFLERFGAAAADGFRGVEFLFPYAHPAAEIKSRLETHGLTAALFNAPAGNWEQGERGLAALPGREEECRRGVDHALEYARIIGSRRLHVMAGSPPAGSDRAAGRATYLSNLAHAAAQAATLGITVVIEPLNPGDTPGYFLRFQADAHEICAEVGAPNLKVQCDLYHAQIVEGGLAAMLCRHHAGIGHMQVAGVPERQEPDVGEVNYPYLFDLIDELGYTGWIGCEYNPRAGTTAGLGWVRRWLR